MNSPLPFRRLATLLLTSAAALSTSAAIIPVDRLPSANPLPWNPGLPGGIPTRTTIFRTIDAATYGNGTTDATQAIQQALLAAPDHQVVFLPEGTYRITAMLQLRSGDILRGAGPGRTRIIIEQPLRNSWEPVLSVGIGGFGFNDSTAVAVTGGATLGSTSITVANASAINTGDILLLDQVDDASTPTGNGTWAKRHNAAPINGYTVRSLGQMVEIAGKSGNTLALTSPLHWTFTTAQQAQLVRSGNYDGANNTSGVITRYAGVEDLTVANGQGSSIRCVLAAYCWLRNVESANCSGRSVMLEGCHRFVIRDSYIHDAPAYNTGGGSYGLSIGGQSSDCLFENNIVVHFNIVAVFENSGGGNVVAYNYLDNPFNNESPGWHMPGLDTHLSVPHMELVEGNHGSSMGGDNIHGGSFCVTFLRNRITGYPRDIPVSNHNAFVIDAKCYRFNSVGNVLLAPEATNPRYEGLCTNAPTVYNLGGNNTGDACTPPADPNVSATLLRHGNYDYFTRGVVWDPTIADHNIPHSLYLSSAPSWWPAASPWPWIDGANPANLVPGVLPAKARYDAMPQPPLIIRFPYDVVLPQLTGNIEFFMVAIGNGPIAYQWQISPNDGETWSNLAASATYLNTTTPKLTIAGVTTETLTHVFRCVATNSVGSSTNVGVGLQIDSGAGSPNRYPPSILVQPKDVTAAAGSNVFLNVPAYGYPYPSFRWQRSTNGGSTWASLTESPTYRGTATEALAIVAATTTMTGDRFRCVATNTEGSATTNAVVLTVTAAPADTYAAWRAANFSAADAANDAVSGPLADPDGAGVTNLQRYAFNLPARGSVPSPIILDTADVAAGRVLTLTFPRRAVASDLSYIVEGSSDLVTWTPVPGQTYAPGTPASVTTRDSVALGTAGVTRRFLRVRVTTP